MAKTPKSIAELTQDELMALATEQAKQIADLQEELKAALAASQESSEKDAVISDLMKKVSELEASNKVAGNAPEVITHKKEKYIVRIPSFRHNGAKCTVDTLKDNPELIDELIEMKSGVIEKISK